MTVGNLRSLSFTDLASPLPRSHQCCHLKKDWQLGLECVGNYRHLNTVSVTLIFKQSQVFWIGQFLNITERQRCKVTRQVRSTELSMVCCEKYTWNSGVALHYQRQNSTYTHLKQHILFKRFFAPSAMFMIFNVFPMLFFQNVHTVIEFMEPSAKLKCKAPSFIKNY